MLNGIATQREVSRTAVLGDTAKGQQFGETVLFRRR
jgi:hypothetical protein